MAFPYKKVTMETKNNHLNNKRDTAKCNLFNIKLRLNANK